MRHLYCTTKCKSKLSGACLSNNRVLRIEYFQNIALNPDSDNESSRRFLGREFQTKGAEKQKLRFPNRRIYVDKFYAHYRLNSIQFKKCTVFLIYSYNYKIRDRYLISHCRCLPLFLPTFTDQIMQLNK